MKIGAHVSIAGGIEHAPANASQLGCECFQMFTSAPQRWPQKDMDPRSVDGFLSECQKHGFSGRDYVVHAPYLINLASINNRIYYGSINALRNQLQHTSLIKSLYLITHIGSAKDVGEEESRPLVMKALEKIHDGYKGSAKLLFEIAAGSGNIIGDTFEEIAYFLIQARKKKIELGFCFDSCHSFAAGYDMRKKADVEKMFSQMDDVIGIENLKVVHLNDSLHEFNTHKDHHAHIGKGAIGEEGLRETINFLKSLDINVIIETEHDKVKADINLVKNWRDQPQLF